MIHARISRSEIVECNAHTRFPQRAEHRLCRIEVAHNGALGDLYFEAPRRQAGFA